MSAAAEGDAAGVVPAWQPLVARAAYAVDRMGAALLEASRAASLWSVDPPAAASLRLLLPMCSLAE